MSAQAAVGTAALAVREKLQGKVAQVKVRRYWPGRAPDWAKEADEEEDFVQNEPSKAAEAPLIKDDARLRRIAESRREREEAIQRHREIRAAEVVSTRRAEQQEKEEKRRAEEEEEEDEEAIEARRARIKARLLEKQKEEELPQEEEEDEEEEEEESEYETDSEDEYGGVAMVKPVFVPKKERETVVERERIEAEELAEQERAKKRLEERKVETKQIVIEQVRLEEEAERNGAGQEEAEDVITDDEVNEAEEYEAWKQRELARIRREREERDAREKEREEVEKLRLMTEEERREYERRNPKQQPSTAKKKWKFMQKYYHKGAFFQEDPDDTFGTAAKAPVYHRDFSAPTGEDKLDKTVLPKVMQVKHFGRSGRTKWSHLVAEDTTQWDNPWTYNDPLRAKYNQKMAGMNRPLEKPKGTKKLKDWGDVKQ